MNKLIPFHRAYIPSQFQNMLPQLVEQPHLEGGGIQGNACEDILSSYLNDRLVLMTSSCTTALEAAVTLSDIGPGDEVIVPSYTFVATASAVARAGATPVFVDINRDTLCIDLDSADTLINHKTKAIIPVHYNGFSCDMDRLLDIAQKHHLMVIEDAAQALFCSYRGQPLGGFGDFGCFSFHHSKAFSAGEGGALVVGNKAKEEAAAIWHDKGTNRRAFLNNLVDKYGWAGPGTNACMSELNAYFLRWQLEEAQSTIAKRHDMYQRYHRSFFDIECDGIQFMNIPTWNTTSNYHFYYMVMPNKEKANALIQYLKEQSIQALQHYPPLHQSTYAQKIAKNCDGVFPNSNYIADGIVRLPLYVGLSSDQQLQIVEAVRHFIHKMQ